MTPTRLPILARLPILTAMLGMTGAALFALSPAMAATGNEPVGQAANPPQSSDIVVEAPRALPKPRRPNRFLNEAELVATVRVPVMYYDLDLTKPEGEKRPAAAKDLDAEIDEELDREVREKTEELALDDWLRLAANP